MVVSLRTPALENEGDKSEDAYGTRCSRAVTYQGTNHAQCRLISVIE